MKNEFSDTSFLPRRFITGITETRFFVWEIRLRLNAPTIVETEKGRFYLGEKGIETEQKYAIFATKEDIDHILFFISGQAIYRISDAMKSGAIFTESGVRIGICGKTVIDNGKILSMTDVSSLCIRFPYHHEGNAEKILPLLIHDGKLLPTLILSPPAGGKTTLLREFAVLFAKSRYNVIVIDERLELSCGNMLTGVDVIKNCPKKDAFLIALRSLNPDVVFCDEIISEEEIAGAYRLVRGGVVTFASAHGNSLEKVQKLYPGLCGVFERFVLLMQKGGRVAQVFSNDLHRIGEIGL